MAFVDPGTVMNLAPKSWRPTIATAMLCAVMVSSYFLFFAGPIAAASAGVKANKDSIDTQQKLNSQIERRLSAIEGGQNSMSLQLGDLKGAVDQQADNQKMILQFLLTGQRPKPH